MSDTANRQESGPAEDRKEAPAEGERPQGAGDAERADAGSADAGESIAPEPPAEERSEPSEHERELAEVKEKLLRTLADLENMRRRHQRELEDARRYAMTSFARDLLDIADNLRRAVAAVPAEAREESEFMKNLLTGVEMTERSLLGAFEKHHIKRIEPARGEKFDHGRHQAMFEVPTNDLPAGRVAEVMQDGYVLSDRLLRPALVGVSKAEPANDTTPS